MGLTGDAYFLVGIALLAVSTVGIFWIIRALQKRNESDQSVPTNFSEFFSPPAPVATPTFAPADVTPAVPESTSQPAVTLEILFDQLEEIRQALQSISAKLDQPPPKMEMTEEIKALLQNVKPPNGAKSDPTQISELSGKIEKIYQVLASISGSSAR